MHSTLKHRRTFVVKMTLLFITPRSGEKAIFQVFYLLSLSGRIPSLRPGGYSKTLKSSGMGNY